jgi:hypothetical protein
MVADNAPRVPSPDAIMKYRRLEQYVYQSSNAVELWRRHLTRDERMRLGGESEDLELACSTYKRTAGIWAALRGVTYERAVIDVAHVMGFLHEPTYQWLLREFGETLDGDELSERAIASGDLVLIDNPRAIFWAGSAIEVDWHKQRVHWNYFWELARHSKAGGCLDGTVLGEHPHRNILADRKSKLINSSGFPLELGDHIVAVGKGLQKLDLPAETIRLFVKHPHGELREWKP